MQMRNS